MSYWKSKNIISKQRAHDQASEMYFNVGLTFQHLIRKELLVDPEQVAGTGEVAEKVFVVVRQEWEVLWSWVETSLSEASLWLCWLLVHRGSAWVGGINQQLCGLEGAVWSPGKEPWVGTVTV